jgi:prepilin-type processing-associated H-X9-DG protein
MDLSGDGAFQLGSRAVRVEEITDGLSQTILAGEKHVPLNGFGVGFLDSSQYNGEYLVSSTRAAGPGMSLAGTPWDAGWRFGSYHPTLCQFVFADGSVQIIRTGINPATLSLLVSINDSQAIPDY